MTPTSITLLELPNSTIAPLTETLYVLLLSGMSEVNDVLLDKTFEGRPTLEGPLGGGMVLEETVSMEEKPVLLPPYIGASKAVGLTRKVMVTYDVVTPGSSEGMSVRDAGVP